MAFDASELRAEKTPALKNDASARTMEMFQSDASWMTSDEALFDGARDLSFETAILTRLLEKSRLAGAFLACMNRYNGQIVLTDQVETATYDRAAGNIHINPNRPRAEQVLLAARELRRLWQHRNGALLDPLTFHPDQAILVNRAQIADMNASMVRIAWELQLAGEKECWMRIEDSPLEDLARAFAREAFLDFRTISNGAASCAVFEAWFLSERCSHEDRRLIQQMLADYQGYVFDAETSSKAITAELIAALGSMPFGKNYLAPYINTIVSDALFTEVRDRSNANFLWFIKFERSFRESEQHLQGGEEHVSHGDRRGSSHKKIKRFGDHEKTAEIISLPRGRAGADAPMEQGAPLNGARILKFRSRLEKGRAG
jgi:hypothetical protein